MFFLGPILALSQPYQDLSWYFGGADVKLVFDKSGNPPDTVTSEISTSGVGATAVAANQESGATHFTVHGPQLFDAEGNQVDNSLAANPDGNQAIALVPNPANDNQYFLFTNSADSAQAGSINFHTVEIDDTSTPTGVTLLPGNTALLSNTAQGMLVVEKANLNDGYWVIAQNITTRQMFVYDINETGVQTAAVSNFTINSTADHLSINPSKNRIAVTSENANESARILEFNNATGNIVSATGIPNSGNSLGNFASAWANDTLLYISGNQRLSQYNINQPNAALSNVVPSSVSIERSLGTQLAPDGAIYHLYQSNGATLLGRVNDPANSPGATDYESGLFGGGDFTGAAMPVFAPNQSIAENTTVNINPVGNCVDQPIIFYPEVNQTAVSYNWTFENLSDGSTITSSKVVPSISFSTPDNQQVVLEVELASGEFVADTTTLGNLVQIDQELDIGPDTTVCSFDPPITLEPNIDNLTSIRWSTGEDGVTSIEADTAGNYWAAVTTAEGCNLFATRRISLYGEALQRANKWQFGDNAGIDFNDVDNPVAIPTNIDAPEGVATIADQNGESIIYTNGDDIHNGISGDPYPFNLDGDASASQSAIIVPFPGNETLYYIFTLDAVGTDGDGSHDLRLSVYNQSGDTLIIQDQVLFSNASEKITAIETGDGYEILAHEYNNNTFRRYLLDTDGLEELPQESTGTSFATTDDAQGYMTFSQEGESVAVTLPGQQAIEVFEIDSITGELTNPRLIDLSAHPGTPYGVAFSAGGTILHTTLKGTGSSELVKIHVKDNELVELGAENISGEVGAIQFAPDNRYYIAVDGASALQAFQPTSDTTADNIESLEAFALSSGTTSGLGLPNFIQNIFDSLSQPGMTVTPGCTGTETNFSGQGTSEIDEYTWTVTYASNGQQYIPAEESQSFTHTFDSAATYNVTLTITNPCGLDTSFSEAITIPASSFEPTLPSQASLCQDDVSLNANADNVSDLSFIWNTGDTTATLEVAESGTYTVNITDGNGCQKSDQVIVTDNSPDVNLGGDLAFCQGDAQDTIGTELVGGDYQWNIYDLNDNNNDVAATGDTLRQVVVSTSTIGDFRYKLRVTDRNGCFGEDSVNISIGALPQFTVDTTTSTCTNSDGKIKINGESYYSYEWGTGATADSITNIPGGSYTVTITDDNSNCSKDTVITLDDGNANFTIDNATDNTADDCTKGNEDMQVVLSPSATLDINYELYDSLGNFVTNGTASNQTFVISNLSRGNYSLRVTDNNGTGCTQSQQNIQITDVGDSVDFTLTSFIDECGEVLLGDYITPAPGSGTAYNWTSNNTNNANISTPATTNDEGAITVLADNGVDCPSTKTTQVNIFEVPETSILSTAQDFCDGEATLNADPSNNAATYSWEVNGTSNGNFNESLILEATDNTTTYDVTLTVTENGCSDDTTQQFEVFPEPVLGYSLLNNACATTDGEFETEINITFTNPNNINYDTLFWISPQGDRTNNTNPYSAFTEGEYTLGITYGAGACPTADTIINLKGLPIQDLEDEALSLCVDPELETSETDTLNPGDFAGYTWTDSLNNDLGTSPTLLIDESVVNENTLQDGTVYVIGEFVQSNGCTTSKRYAITQACEPIVRIPNVFRPNSSIAENQVIKLLYDKYVTPETFRVLIFDRWGNVIFESDYETFKNNGWDGTTSGGNVLPSGTYTILMKYNRSSEEQRGLKEDSRTITLIK